jgi:NAD-dependent DNA ligase
MDIEGLGTEVIESLVENGLVRTVADIFALDRAKLLGLKLSGGSSLQELSVARLIDNIDRAKRPSLARLIFGLGIRHVGEATAKELAQFYGSIGALMRTAKWTPCLLPDIGVEVALAIHDFVSEPHNEQVVRQLLTAGVEPIAPDRPSTQTSLGKLLEAVKRVDVALVQRRGRRSSSDQSGQKLGGIGFKKLEEIARHFRSVSDLIANRPAIHEELEVARERLANELRLPPWLDTVKELHALAMERGAHEPEAQEQDRHGVSQKLRRILLAKSPFSPQQIDKMSEREGWAWIYSQHAPRKESKQPEVCFTGFSVGEKQELESAAEAAHLRPVSSVTKSLLLLVAGENAGPSKLAKARAQGTAVVDRAGFEAFLETGELPGP